MATKSKGIVFNNKHEIRVVRADRLVVDHKYQRNISDASIETLANNFDPDALGTLVISPRSRSSYFDVLDGQKRTAALRRAYPGLKVDGKPILLRCEVRKCRSTSNRAKMFVKLNENQKSINANDAFHASLAAGSKMHREVVATMCKHGINPFYGKGRLPLNHTRALGLFLNAYKRLNGRFDLFCEAISKHKCPKEKHIESVALQSLFLDGMLKFLEFNNYRPSDVRKHVGYWTAATIVEHFRENTLANKASSGYTRGAQVAKIIKTSCVASVHNQCDFASSFLDMDNDKKGE